MSHIIRPMTKQDIKHLLKMETGRYRWIDKTFLSCWDHGFSKMVCVTDQKIVGYIVYEFTTEYIRLIKVNTLKDYESYKKILVDFVKDKLTPKRKKIVANVNERDKDFIYCLRHNQFLAITPILKEHYGKDDAYVMEYIL